MDISPNGLGFLSKEEGCRLKPYLDSVKKPTIGYGSTFYADGTPVKLTDKPITQRQAVELFHITLKKYVSAVNKAVTVDLNQNQFDACVSLCYNIGTSGFAKSSLVKLINAGASAELIVKAFEAWRNAGGKPMLLKRRKREAALYFS